MPYEPSQEDRFTLGLWCTQYAGREVWDLVRGCIRSYLVLKEKAQRFNQDQEIQSIPGGRDSADGQLGQWQTWSLDNAQALKNHGFDLSAMSDHPFGYQRLDQLTFELLTGVR